VCDSPSRVKQKRWRDLRDSYPRLERQRFAPIGFYPRPGKLAGDLAAGRLKSTVRLRTDNISDCH
jgi:hypothetical protein